MLLQHSIPVVVAGVTLPSGVLAHTWSCLLPAYLLTYDPPLSLHCWSQRSSFFQQPEHGGGDTQGRLTAQEPHRLQLMGGHGQTVHGEWGCRIPTLPQEISENHRSLSLWPLQLRSYTFSELSLASPLLFRPRPPEPHATKTGFHCCNARVYSQRDPHLHSSH